MNNKRNTIVGIILIIVILITGYFIIDKNNKSTNKGTVNTSSSINGSSTNVSQDTGETDQTNLDYTKMNSAGMVGITATYLNPTQPDKYYLDFDIALETHSVDLGKYKLDKITQLETSNGTVVSKGIIWQSNADGGHHINGILKVPANGVIKSDTKFIKLVMKNIEGTPRLEFTWDKGLKS